jgi:hypothetical protein
MSLDDIKGRTNKAVEMRAKLISNNKDCIKEETISLWEKGFLKDSELSDRIVKNDVRESFMYYTLLINEFKEEERNEMISKMKRFKFSC